jgi:hypothetical protein
MWHDESFSRWRLVGMFTPRLILSIPSRPNAQTDTGARSARRRSAIGKSF